MADMQFTDATDTLLKMHNEAKELAKEKAAAKLREKAARDEEKIVKAIEGQAKLARNLADAEELRHVPAPYKKGRGHLYDLSNEERTQCVQDYFACGSLKEVALKHNIVLKEMLDAASQSWWVMEISGLQRESILMMKSKLDRIMNMTLEQLEDRVTNGETNFDKDGGSFRCPVSAQTLATIANVIFDKKLKLEDRASGFVEGENKRLIDLANSLTMMGAKAVEVIDVDVIDDVESNEGNENE